ncbi:MAG: META domain-containing protein [Anaerolineales bacterium]|nr:META domain-containing protein [Anaerolineales bacterium]
MLKKISFIVLLGSILAACTRVPDGGYPGRYQANLDPQVLILWLDSNGNATLSQDAGNGQAPQVDEGRWVGSEDSLDLTFNAGVLTFGREDDDSLTLVDDINGIAPAGVALQPTTALMDTRWVWLQTVANGQSTRPSTQDAFVLTFNDLGFANMETDCNGGSGSFVVAARRGLSFPMIATTMMFCESSNEGDFYAQLGLVESWSLTADGVLELHLGGDGGTMEFSPEA